MTNRNRKLKPETIERIGVAAIGAGSALLYVANEDFRNGIKQGLRQRLNTPQKNTRPHASATGATRPVGSPRPTDFSSTCPSKGVVYLLKAGPFYKIGKAVDFTKRLNQIKLQLPYPVEVIHRIASDDITAIERYWHRKFAHQRANGEWFTLSDSEVAEFRAVAKM